MIYIVFVLFQNISRNTVKPLPIGIWNNESYGIMSISRYLCTTDWFLVLHKTNDKIICLKEIKQNILSKVDNNASVD